MEHIQLPPLSTKKTRESKRRLQLSVCVRVCAFLTINVPDVFI